MTLLGMIGAVTIWPEKIGILYAIATHVTMFALSRINLAVQVCPIESLWSFCLPLTHY